MINEAKAAGCRVIEANPSGERLPDPRTRKIPLTIIVNPDESLAVARHEIFGPVLTIHTYRELGEAIALINRREKPLAMYIFGKDRSAIRQAIAQTSGGGVTVNDLSLHAGTHTMGFGGVGYSGMGRYTGGLVGYKAFCNEKAVYEQGLLGRFTASFLVPWSSERPRKLLRRMAGLN